MLSALLLSVSGGNASAAVSPMNHKHAPAMHASCGKDDAVEGRAQADAAGTDPSEGDHEGQKKEQQEDNGSNNKEDTQLNKLDDSLDSKLAATHLPPAIPSAANTSLPLAAGPPGPGAASLSSDSLGDPLHRAIPSSTPHTVRSLTSGYELSRPRGTRGDPKASPPAVPGEDDDLAQQLQGTLPGDFLQRQRVPSCLSANRAAAAASHAAPSSVLPPVGAAEAGIETISINSNLSRFMRTELGSQIFINQLCSGGFFLKHSAPTLALASEVGPAPTGSAPRASPASSSTAPSHSPHWRMLWVSRDLRVVYWGEMTHSLTKRPSGMIQVADILVMLRGHRTRTFTDTYGTAGGDATLPAIAAGPGVRHCSPSCCLSLVTPARTLDLECTSAPERELWALAFQFLLDQQREKVVAGAQQPSTLRSSSPSIGVDATAAATAAGVPVNLSLVSALEILSDLVVLGPTHAAFSYFIPKLPPSPGTDVLAQGQQRHLQQQSQQSSAGSSTRTSATTSPAIGGGGGGGGGATGPMSLRRLATMQPQSQRSISVGAAATGGGDGSGSTSVSSATPFFFGSPQQPQQQQLLQPQQQVLQNSASVSSMLSLSSNESTGSPPTNLSLATLESRPDSAAGTSSLLLSPPRLASTTGATTSPASVVPFFPTLDAVYGTTTTASAIAGPPSTSSASTSGPPPPGPAPPSSMVPAGMPRRKSFGSLEPLTEAPDEESASAGGAGSQKPSAATMAASHALLPPTAAIAAQPREESLPSGSPMPLLLPSTHEPALGSRSIGMAAVVPTPEPLYLPPPASTLPASSHIKLDAHSVASSGNRPSATHSSLHSLYMSIQGGAAARSSAAAASNSNGSGIGASGLACSPDAPMVMSARQEAELLRLDRYIHRERSDHAHLRLWVAHRFMHLQSHINSLCIERSKLQRRLQLQAEDQEKQFEREVARIAGATPKLLNRSLQDRSHSAVGAAVTAGAR